MTPTLSILTPSRGRFDGLLRMVRSFHSLPAEIIVRIDSDDLEYFGRLPALTDCLNVRVIIGQRGRGYLDNHLMLNECAALARGEWLLVLNDDAWLDTGTLPSPTDEPKVFFTEVEWPIDHNLPAYKAFARRQRMDFPCINRAAYKRIGCFSPTAVADWFWLECSEKVLSLGGEVGHLRVFHNYERRTNFYDGEADQETHVVEYKSEAMQQTIRQCIERLK